MPPLSRPLVLAAGVAALAVSVLAGCTPTSVGHTTPQSLSGSIRATTDAPTSHSSADPTPAATSAPASSSTNKPAPPPPPFPSPTRTPMPTQPLLRQCATQDFTISYESPNDDSAGKIYGTLVFLNTSGTACEINGSPSVWFEKNGDVGPVGVISPLKTIAEITLQPSEWATAAVTIADGDNIQGCVPEQVTHFDVRAPGSSAGVNVPIPATDACKGNTIAQLTIGALKFK